MGEWHTGPSLPLSPSPSGGGGFKWAATITAPRDRVPLLFPPHPCDSKRESGGRQKITGRTLEGQKREKERDAAGWWLLYFSSFLSQVRPTEQNEGGPKSNEKTLSPAKGGGGGKGPLAPIDTADRGKEEERFWGRPLLTLIWVRNLFLARADWNKFRSQAVTAEHKSSCMVCRHGGHHVTAEGGRKTTKQNRESEGNSAPKRTWGKK